jgi:hypothetical protein
LMGLILTLTLVYGAILNLPKRVESMAETGFWLYIDKKPPRAFFVDSQGHIC